MLLSYLKIAWKVLLRRKFFTFISLFGISFTLMILLVVYAFYDHAMGPHTPEKKIDRLLFINRMSLEFKDGGRNNSSVSYSFLERYVRPLKTPEKVSICTFIGSTVAYRGNQKLKLSQKYTDGAFWQVLDFDFVAGRSYLESEVKNAAHVAVINESTSRQYFGTVAGAVGQEIELDRVRYRVVGVVQDVPAMRFNSYADVWLPITTNTTLNIHDPEFLGNCMAILLAPTPEAMPQVQAEFARVLGRAPLPDPVNFKVAHSFAAPLLASTVRMFNNNTEANDGVGRFLGAALGLGLLFMLLPALNLININVSRILERSSEIGVRKAFGATAGTLVGQFLVENVFLTLLGGLLGLGLAAGVLHLIDGSGLIAYTHLTLNWRIFLWALGASLLFGLLSGVYPAYKMSKLQTVQALRVR